MKRRIRQAVIFMFSILLLLNVPIAERLYFEALEAPATPPLAIGPPAEYEGDYDDGGASLWLRILIIIVASATALALGFFVYWKLIPKLKILAAKMKEKKNGKRP